MEIKIDVSEVIAKAKAIGDFAQIKKDVEPDFKQATTDFLEDVQQEAPFDTGQLVRATGITYTGQLQADVGTDLSRAPYVKYVISGTRPHDITPKTKGALAFPIGGNMLIRGKVRHPGTKANPYIVNSWHKHGDEFTEKIEKAFATAIEEAE